MAADKTTIIIKSEPWKAARGHQPRRSGAGVHGDRRLKRQHTRATQLRAALRD